MERIEISDFAYDYLKSLAIPFEDTPSTVLDRVLLEHAGVDAGKAPTGDQKAGLELSFGIDNVPSVSFTNIVSATLSGKPAKSHYWNDILQELIEMVLSEDRDTDIRDALTLQIRDGEHHEHGYRYVPKAGWSFQGVDAARACKNIVALAKTFNVAIKITIQWQNNPKAQFAGQTGTLTLP